MTHPLSEAGTSVEVKLAPCPFCGGDTSEDNATQSGMLYMDRFRGAHGGMAIRVACRCGALGKAADCVNRVRGHAEAEAIEAWNRRALIQPTPAETEGVPYKEGDLVVTDLVDDVLTVQDCFDAVGGWRVIAQGRRDISAGNPSGRYDLPITSIEPYSPAPTPPPPPIGDGEGDLVARLRDLLTAEDDRQTKIHELLETIREQIRNDLAPEHRPEGLFTNIQNAVYAMRGRMPLMNDAALLPAVATAIESLTRQLEEAREALTKIAEHPETYRDESRSYAVGWAFFNVQNIAKSALAAAPRRP